MGYGISVKEAGEIEMYRFGRSQQIYRGPKPSLKRSYVAFIGGSEPFGKFVASPFPKLVQKNIKKSCVNWGTPGAGPGFFLKDPVLLEACSNADVCVVQAMNTEPLSNRMYSVFPRRNQRVRGVSEAIKALYPTIDFSQFKYVSAMLRKLREVDSDAFSVVEAELKAAWLARMLELLEDIETTKVLLWLKSENNDTLLNEEMIDVISKKVDHVVAVDIPAASTSNRFVSASRESSWMTKPAHQKVADTLSPKLKEILNEKSSEVAA